MRGTLLAELFSAGDYCGVSPCESATPIEGHGPGVQLLGQLGWMNQLVGAIFILCECRYAAWETEHLTMPIVFTTGGKNELVPPQSILRLAFILWKIQPDKDLNSARFTFHGTHIRFCTSSFLSISHRDGLGHWPVGCKWRCFLRE